jgi:photosystem II stability/assembly factor-like uncharacterized protein
MPTDDPLGMNTTSSSESQSRKSTELMRKIFSGVILLEIIALWVFVFKVILYAKIRGGEVLFVPPIYILCAVVVGLSFIGLGFANWLNPRIPGIPLKRVFRWVVGLLLAGYIFFPTYEKFRGEDDVYIATLGLFDGRTIQDAKRISPSLTVFQHNQKTFRVEISKRDARRLERKRYKLIPIQGPAERMKVERINKLHPGVPNAAISEMVHSVSADSLLDDIRDLEGYGTRVEYSAQEDSAAEYLKREFQHFGLSVESLTFGQVSPILSDVQVVDSRTFFLTDLQGQFFTSTDGGMTWSCRQNSPEPLLRIAFFDARMGFAIGTLNGIYGTMDGGRTWQPQKPDTVVWFSDIRCLSAQRALLVGKQGVVLITEDGGKRWERIRLQSKQDLHRIEIGGDRSVWVVGAGGTVLRSLDMGRTWSHIRAGVSCSLSHIQFLDRFHGIILGGGATILNTRDGGKSWKKILGDANEIRPADMLFIDQKHGWIVDSRVPGLLLETRDGGEHWQKGPKELQNLKKLSGGKTGIILGCGRNAELFLSGDRGTTWKSLSPKLASVSRLRSRNICATLKGSKQAEVEVILVGHYDSAGKNVPGGNDNASGTAALLEAARICSRYKFERTIRFLAVAAEERGLVGSAIYARDARNSGRNIVAVVNADMIGYPVLGDSKRIAITTGKSWTPLMDSTLLFNRRYSLGLVLDAHLSPFGGSDHESFIRYGYQAIDISEGTAMEIWSGFDPYYHRPLDTSDKLDGNLVRHSVQLMIVIAAETAIPVEEIGNQIR